MASLIVKFLLLISLDLIKSLKIQAYYLFSDWFQTARIEPMAMWFCSNNIQHHLHAYALNMAILIFY